MIELEPYNGGKMLEGIFLMKLELLERYEANGWVPPVKEASFLLDHKVFQGWLKEIKANITVELAEVSHENDQAMFIYNQEGATIEPKKLLEYAVNSIEETMDVMQWLIELMIYADINAEEINDYYAELTKERNLSLIHMSDGLASTHAYGRHTNIYDDQIRMEEPKQFNFQIPIGHQDKITTFTHVYRISPAYHSIKEICMWNIAKHLSLAGQELKLKMWKVEEIKTNTNQYKLGIMLAWLYFGQLLDLMGLEPKDTYLFFTMSVDKLHTRLDNGY